MIDLWNQTTSRQIVKQQATRFVRTKKKTKQNKR